MSNPSHSMLEKYMYFAINLHLVWYSSQRGDIRSCVLSFLSSCPLWLLVWLFSTSSVYAALNQLQPYLPICALSNNKKNSWSICTCLYSTSCKYWRLKADDRVIFQILEWSRKKTWDLLFFFFALSVVCEKHKILRNRKWNSSGLHLLSYKCCVHAFSRFP